MTDPSERHEGQIHDKEMARRARPYSVELFKDLFLFMSSLSVRGLW